MTRYKTYAIVVMILCASLDLVGGEAKTCYFGPPPEPDPNNPDPHHWMKQALPEIRKNCPGKPSAKLAPVIMMVCHDSPLIIVCDSNKVIDMQWSLYGRESGSLECMGNHGLEAAGTCVHETVSLGKLKIACQGEQSCAFMVSNSFFDGDPCPGTAKYLLVRYACV